MTSKSRRVRRVLPKSVRSSSALRLALKMPVEQLESRTMLTVSTASWVDPLFQAGTAYTIQSTGSSGQSTNFTTTNKGPTTFNGTPCTEFDITNSVNSGVGITYAGM